MDDGPEGVENEGGLLEDLRYIHVRRYYTHARAFFSRATLASRRDRVALNISLEVQFSSLDVTYLTL